MASGDEATQQNIVVGIRMRPQNAKEKSQNDSKIWKTDSGSGSITDLLSDYAGTERKELRFDHVFDEACKTKQVYDTMASGIINGVIKGYNGTIFAYGQTASGKTHSLMGNEKEPGFITLSIQHIFNSLESLEGCEFLVRVSYLEIYNEEIQDLLSPEDANADIDNEADVGTKSKKTVKSKKNSKYIIVDDKVYGPIVKGLNTEVVKSVDEVLKLLAQGEAKRHFGSTNMNLHSSRSHTLFRMSIETKESDDDKTEDDKQDKKPFRTAILNLVDLAGSERIAKVSFVLFNLSLYYYHDHPTFTSYKHT